VIQQSSLRLSACDPSDHVARQDVLPAIKMMIGEWYVDELGVRTREITARE
jgi:hypothetical protein